MTCVGDWLPRHVFHKGYALCAYIRMIYVAIYVVYFSGRQFDVIVCDQISACIPVLRRGGAKILFYCHFPDQLLTERKSRLKKAYRWPLDKLEEKTTGMADAILVNCFMLVLSKRRIPQLLTCLRNDSVEITTILKSSIAILN